MKILIVEDEQALRESIVTYLQQVGYVCESADALGTGIRKAADFSYACLIVDLTLPGGNGLEIVKTLKENNPDTGIIIISAKNALDDKLTGLEMGADDYLTKPFHLAELNARLRSVIRRRNFSGHNTIKAGKIEVNTNSAEVIVKDEKLLLTKKEYYLLLYFLANRNRVLTKDAIAEHLWGDHMDGFDSLDFIYTHIKNLRRKLLDSCGEDYIQTVYGLGYKFST
ncbi:response regulator transcription factor [Pontibacter sp. 13R65]|uniref:response regulator transcription factor n=1 Tax=Pontibacter sp. 13R65 TaxID=3127458 RepID=UPI00301D7F41